MISWDIPFISQILLPQYDMSRVSNIESDDSQNVGLEDYNTISDGIFPKKIFYEGYWTRRPTFIGKCFWKFWFLRYVLYFLKLCPVFVGSVHNFGTSDDDII